MGGRLAWELGVEAGGVLPFGGVVLWGRCSSSRRLLRRVEGGSAAG